MKAIGILMMVLLCFGVHSFGQVTETANSTGIIITPIGITKTVDMNFGTITVNGAAGTVVLTPAGNRTVSGGAAFVPAYAATAASFTVTGLSSYTYTITLPDTPHTIVNGSNSMTITNFTSDPSGTGILNDGSQTLLVGATLHIAAGQPTGQYVSETGFSVSVNYN